jgi:hypothetical protein
LISRVEAVLGFRVKDEVKIMFRLRIKVWRVFRVSNDILGVGYGWGQIEELLKGRALLRLKLRMQHNLVLQHNRKEFN